MAAENGSQYNMHDLGVYYEEIKNYDLMKHYYLMAIDNGCSFSIAPLAIYYKDIEINHELMVKYFKMSIENGNIQHMDVLGNHYKEIQNYDLMKQYYLMAIDKGFHISMYNLANYYKYIEKDYDLMLNYYLMAINNNCNKSMVELAHYYYTTGNNELMRKYLLMTGEVGQFPYEYEMFDDYAESIDKYNLIVIEVLKETLEFTSNDDCIVCYEKKDLYKLKCKNHSICFDCYYQIVFINMDKRCPYCRQ